VIQTVKSRGKIISGPSIAGGDMSKTLFTQVQYDLNGLMGAVRMGKIGLPDIQRPFIRFAVCAARSITVNGL